MFGILPPALHFMLVQYRDTFVAAAIIAVAAPAFVRRAQIAQAEKIQAEGFCRRNQELLNEINGKKNDLAKMELDITEILVKEKTIMHLSLETMLEKFLEEQKQVVQSILAAVTPKPRKRK
jgi:hypothetical protein